MPHEIYILRLGSFIQSNKIDFLYFINNLIGSDKLIYSDYLYKSTKYKNVAQQKINCKL